MTLTVLPQLCASFPTPELKAEAERNCLEFFLGIDIVHQLTILDLLCLSRGVGRFSWPLRHLELALVCESRHSSCVLTGTCRPDHDGLSCRRGGAMIVPGYRSDGRVVGARLLHNGVGYRSLSATMGDIALGRFCCEFSLYSATSSGRGRPGLWDAPAVVKLAEGRAVNFEIST